MKRLAVVILVAIVVAAADMSAHYAIGFGAGIAVGAFYFLIGAAQGGMRPTGLAAPHLMPKGIDKRQSSPDSGIGCGLAASGIASSVVTNLHYPFPFRVFYGVCIAAGLIIAVVLAWRAQNNQPIMPEPPG